MRAKVRILYTDDQIVAETLESRPRVVSIDAPLFLPRGRRSLEQRGPPHLRQCDRELQRMGIRFFPVSLGPMRMLTARGIHLRGVFERRGLEVIESFPGAAQDILGMPRKQAGLAALEASLRAQGILLRTRRQGYTGDELDGVTCALVGLLYATGRHLAIGDPDEGLMILPSADR